MTLLAFIVPIVIFMQGAPLVLFSIGFFFAISYSTISLYTYGVSKDVERVEEAEGLSTKSEGSSDTTQGENSQLSTFNSQLEEWISNAHYREHNLTLGIVARQMGVSAIYRHYPSQIPTGK